MFERLDVDARRVVDVAIRTAYELGHGWLGTEHVLIGLLTVPAALPAQARVSLPAADDVRRRLQEGLRPGRSGLSDEELLASLGIDLDEVRRRAAAAFGADAVERAAVRARMPGRRRRRRACERPQSCMTVVPGESLRMAPRLKRAFADARRRCARDGQAVITPIGLLAGLLAIQDGLACEILCLMGVDVPRVRAALEAGRPEV